MTEALTSNYWISPNAVRITLNAMGMKDYIQCGAAGGAVIMCYIRDVDGLGYDAGHNYRRWPIVTAPVYFNSWTRKYVYIAIPRSTAVGTSAILVFPSKHIDLYGMTEPAEGETEGEQIGSKDYYYIFLRGVISPSRSDDDADQLREWEEYVDYGTLSTDQQVSEGDSEWWRYNADDDTVTFLKVITNATFKVLNVLKNLTVGGDGSFGGSLSVAKDAVVGGLLTAVSAVINSIKSTNYSGSGMADTGWSITNDNGSGSSEAVFDYLTVRKKMTINSLEIKETHFTAGDICQSLATAEIVRTDYYYVDPDSGEMEKLGYSKYRVPWLLKGLALVLGKRAQNMKIFSRWKTVRINLTRNELLRCNRVRCYFLAKDGEREIENWWRENDLARCQTWNMTKAQRNTFIPNFNDHAGNIYWWRTVKNTSWNTGLPRYLLTDGDGNPKDPSDLSNTTTDPDNPNIYRNEAGLKYEVTNGTYNNEKGTQSYKDHQPAVIDGKTYHWIDIAFDGSREIDDNGRLIGDRTGWCDANSDIPAAGDKVVQFGNTVDPDRMNLMLWEVNGSGNMDAPDWKMYAGIYTFDLNLCWWGGTPQKTKWSYRTGIRVYAPKFEWITEYGIAKQAFDRGHWTELPLERDDDTRLHEDDLSYYPEYPDDIKNPDGTFKSRKNGEPRNFIRKCHYYDRVSHEGSMWLCSINETNYWVAKETFTTADHVSYTKGDRISNFSSLSTEDKTHCEQVRNYTFDEPSIASLDWMEVVEKGDDGSFKSRVFCRSNDTPLAPSNEVKTVSGITYNTFNNPVPPPVTGQPHWHDGAPDGTAILWSSTAWFYPNGTHTEWTTPSPETDTADLDIEFSPNYNKPDAPYSGNDFTPDMRGNGTAYGVKDATHSNKRANGSGEDANWYDPTADANNTHADWNDMIWRAERKIKNGEYIGSWSITRIKGEQGDTPVTAYRWYKEEAVATTAPTAPTGESVNPTATDHISDGNANPATKWSNVAPNRPATGWCLYMTTSYRFDDGTYGQWTTPIRISGTDGTPGEDAENVEWIYKTSPDTNVTIPTNSPNQKGYVPAGWTNHPTGIDATNIYEFACFRILPEGANVDDTKVWSKWMGILGTGSQGDTPIIWSHWGRNGMDGDGFEYVFVRATTNSAPTIVVKADSYTDSNGHKFTDDEFLPKALVNGTEIECSDDPQSIDPVNKYVWVAKRTKGPANTDTGVRTWEKYSGTMSLWNNWADNAVRIDLDNQADLISLDAEGKVRFARTITTKARIYDGGSVAKSGVAKASTLTAAKLRYGNTTTGCTPTISSVDANGVVTITWEFTKGMIPVVEPKTISLTYKNETYDAVFSLGTTDRDVIYQVQPNPDKVSFSKSSSNALSPASVSLVCDYTKDTGSGTIQTITNVDKSKIDDNNYLYYRVKGSNGNWGSWTAYTGAFTVLNSTTDTDYEFAISTAATAASVTDRNIYEREVVPIVKDGLDGKSITKSSADTYKYKVSDDGTTTPSGTWYSTKQAAIDAYNTDHSISGHDWKQGTFMWTETTIHWSNNTEMILYTNERNSVDGKAGQDIVVDGATQMKYSCKDSNTVDPTTINDWDDYNQVTKRKGWWLWSKATTWYRKADSAAGSHDAGSSINYNVSYIAEDGADGKDGNGIVSITNTYGISASGKTNSDTTAPSDVTTWSAGSPDATTSKPYLWKKEVTVYTDTAKNTTKYYCIGRYGDNGIDAQDVEFVYVRTTHNVAPTIAADTETPQGYKNDDYLPFAKVSSGRIKGGSEANANAAVRCTDDPKGVDNTWKYEWEIKRTKGAAGADGKREWDNYVSGANMTLHNNLAESTLIIDIDNDNDQFGTDSDCRVNSQQTRTTKVTMLYGTEKQAFTSAPTATLKYDDGTSVDITVASVSVTKVTDDNKEYKVTVNINQTPSGTANPPFKTHNGLYVDIEGTCAKGGPKTIRFSLEKVMSGEKGSDAVVYQLAPSQRSFSFGRSNTNEIVAKSNTVTVNLKITQGNNSVIYVSPGSIPSGMTVPTISWGFEDEQTATAEHSNLPVGTAISITPAQLTKGSGLHTKVWIKLSTGDREEIPVIIDGINGEDTISIDLDNQADIIACHTDGKVRFARDVTTVVRMRKGSRQLAKTEITAPTTTAIPLAGKNANSVTVANDGTITVTWKFTTGDTLSSSSYEVSIPVVYNGTTYRARFTLGVTNDVCIYQLATSIDAISFSRGSGNTLTPPSVQVSCGYTKTDADGTSPVSDYTKAATQGIDGKYSIYYRYRNADGTSTSWTLPSTDTNITVRNNTSYSAVEYCLAPNTGASTFTDSNIVDIETVPITKDGIDGRGITNVNTYFKAVASQPSAPTGAPASSGWADDGSTLITKANADAGYHLYESTCTTYTNGTYSWTTPLDDGLIADMASTSEEFALSDSSTTAPTTGWAASVTPTVGKWVWSRTVLTFKNGDKKYVSVQCVGYCGADGKNAIRLALDNEHEDFLYSKDGLVAPSGGATSQAHLYDGPTERNSSVNQWRISDDDGSTWGTSTSTNAVASINTSTGLLTVTEINSDSVKIKVRALYGDVYYYAEFTANKTNQDKYDIVVKPNAIAFNSSTTWTNKTISITAEGINAQGGRLTPNISNENIYAAGQFRIFWGYVKSDGKIYKPSATNTEGTDDLRATSKTVTSTEANNYIGIYFELRLYTSSSAYRLCDYETVEIAKTENGANGDSPISVFSWNLSQNVAPSISGNAYPPTGWSITAPNRPDKYVVERPSFTTEKWNTYGTVGRGESWANTSAYASAMSYGDWFVVKGQATDGEKKHHTLFFEYTEKNGDNLYGICMSHYIDDVRIDEYHQWRSDSVKHTAKNGIVTYDNWEAPVRISGDYGRDGVDGKDAEWVYVRSITNEAPEITNSDDTYQGKTYLDDDYLPLSSVGRCTDNMTGVDEFHPYEWEIRRTKGPAGADGTRTWNKYNGKMKLRTNYSESNLLINLDNDNDEFGTDATSEVLVEQQRTTGVTMYYGRDEQTFTQLSAKLKYSDDDTAVPVSAAVVVAGIKSVVHRDSFTSANWNTYGTVGREEQWSNTSGTRGTCAVNDLFAVVGKDTDAGNYHVMIYKCDNSSGDLHGTCLSHRTLSNSDASTSVISAGTGYVIGDMVAVIIRTGIFGRSAMYALITGTCNKGSLSMRFTLTKLLGGQKGETPVINQLALSPKNFQFARNNDNSLVAVTNSVMVQVKQTIGNDSSIKSLAETGLTYQWAFDNGALSASTTASTRTVSVAEAQAYSKMLIVLSTGDFEELPIVKDGSNGADGTDGADGRAVISASEHYKVSNNDGSAGHQEAKPIADGQENASLEWGTDPNAAIASWGENARYLWNYEKTGYSSGTTPVRTTPRIIAIWTEDGANGKGIDHITNYYKASAKTGIGTDVESYPTTDAEWAAWDDNPVAPTSQNPYLWNFEVIYWVDPTNTTHTTPHVIGHYGQDAEIVTVYQEAESTPAKPTGSTIPPTGWSLTEPRVGYNATEKMDELRLVNTDTDVHTLSRKYIVINNTSAKVKLGIKLVLGGTVYSNSEGVAVYDGNTKVAEQAGRTGTKDNVSIEIAANAKKVYEVRLTRAGGYSAHTIYGCFAFTGGGMNISPMYVWQSHAVFHGTTLSDDGWSDPVTYTARNGDNSDTEKEEFVYIRSKQCDVYPTTDSNSLDINRKYPSEDEYLPWVGNYGSGNPNQFERDYWSDDPSGINNTWPYEFQAHRVKTNGVWGAFGDIKLYQSLGEQGPSGDNAYVVVPENLIVNQNLDGSMPTTDDILFKVKSGGNEWNGTVNTTPAPTATDYLSTLPSGVTATETHSTASVVSGKLRINIGHYSYTYQGKTVTSYYDHVAFALSVTANGVTVSHIFHVYINLLGSFRTTIEGDIEESIATKKFYFKDSNGNIVAHETIGDYIRSSAENTSILTKKVDNGKNLLTGVLTGAAWKSAATVSGTLKNVTMDGYVIMRAEGDSYIVSPNISLTSGTKYTLSFRFETSGSFYIYIKGSSTNISHTASAGSYCSYTFQAPASENVRIYIGLASLYYPQLEIGDTATDFDANTTEVSSRISQTAENIDFTITNKLGETGINIDGNNRKITAKANTFEICNSADTTTFSVDSNGNLVGAGGAKFNGNIEATGGKIGGFDIGQNDLKNTNYGAGITIQNAENNPTKVVKIGNDATDEITENKCSMIAESKGSNTYNTALYLNAQGATYNYAFHGNGNGVLNGFVQGYKVKAISNIGASTYLSLRDGQTQAIISVSIDGRKNVYLPTLGDCRATLGLKDNDTSDFCCRLTVINQTAIQSTNYNRDNISIVGGTHEYTDQITNIQTRPRLLYTSKDTALEIQSAVSCDLIITYINKRFIASYIKTQW